MAQKNIEEGKDIASSMGGLSEIMETASYAADDGIRSYVIKAIVLGFMYGVHVGATEVR
jgi:hypothetical protein